MIETERLFLREWRNDDVSALHQICTDRRVMEFLGPLQSRTEVASVIDRQRSYQHRYGHCYWAIERKSDERLLGFCGIQPEPPGTPIAGQKTVEGPDVGWRLAHDVWGKGYALEAARAAIDWGFANLHAEDTLWAITVPANRRSWGLMERLGMQRRRDLDFDHPSVPPGDPLGPHIAYTIARGVWNGTHG